MCDPSLAAAGGALLSGYGAYKESRAQKEALKYQENEASQNASLQGVMAGDAMQRGREAAQDVMRKVGQEKATQTAVMAANGLDVSQGTPASLLDDTQYMGDIDLGRVKRNAQREAWGFNVQANNYRNTASMLKATGDNINPAMDGVLAAAGSVAGNWSAFSQD